MNRRVFIVISAIIFQSGISAFGQIIDIAHYKYSISLNDSNDSLIGHAIVSGKFLKASNEISLDLVQAKQKTGMIVVNVKGAGVTGFKQADDKLFISYQQPAKANDSFRIEINYRGIPEDGLIISRNKYGKRTFFSDNWPDRAHHWIPCNDIPGDKASVEFIVTAPKQYSVVSNGVLQEEKELDNNKITSWKEDLPLPTKIMVIGVADFAVDTSGYVGEIPVTSWVFPQNKKDGFYDYAPAKDILAFFVNYIGPFPYKKLANVQSKTIFGGMENASVIFYYENSVSGRRDEEGLLAHEIAHQWFGDMITEKNYDHLWLSEGFATYLKQVYMESAHGTERLNTEMKKDRDKVIGFARNSDMPVVDSISPVMDRLNANSYQKGGWVLHMLRRQLGDSIFQQSIRRYYAEYGGKNANTKDFEKICERVSGKNLESFFQQWLYTPGIPKLNLRWKYDESAKTVLIHVTQSQKDLFNFPLEVEIKNEAGVSSKHILNIAKQVQEFNIPAKEKTSSIIADPATSLLFDGTVSRLK